MDLSKLPKLSETPAVPVDPTPSAVWVEKAVPVTQSGSTVHNSTIGAEAWISIGIGLLLLLLTPHTLAYFSSKIFHTPFQPYPDPTRPYPAKCDFILYDNGTKEYYRDRLEFWSDLAITAFAVILLLDGAVIARARRPKPVLIIFCVTVAATAGNLFYLIQTMSSGLPIISACAVIFGGYIAIYQWNLFKTIRRSTGSA